MAILEEAGTPFLTPSLQKVCVVIRFTRQECAELVKGLYMYLSVYEAGVWRVGKRFVYVSFSLRGGSMASW